MAEVIVSGKPLITARVQQETKLYRLKAGKKHYHMADGQTYVLEGGDTVELTAHQAQAFGDKFEAVNGGFDDTRVDRAAGVVHRESGNVTSTDGVKTTTPGEQPAPQPESPKEDVAVSRPESKKAEVKK